MSYPRPRWLRWWSFRPLYRAMAWARRALGEGSARREALRLMQPGPGSTLLDLGCGHGFHLPDLVSTGASVVAVDADPERVEASRATLREGGWMTVKVHDQPRGPLPFGPASFDAVLCERSLSRADDHRALLTEALRVLRPGGCLAVIDLQPARAGLGRVLQPLLSLLGVDPHRPLQEELDRALPLFAHQVRMGGLVFLAVGRKPDEEASDTPIVDQPEPEKIPVTA